MYETVGVTGRKDHENVVGIHGLNPIQHAEGSKVHHHEMLTVPPKIVISGSKESFPV